MPLLICPGWGGAAGSGQPPRKRACHPVILMAAGGVRKKEPEAGRFALKRAMTEHCRLSRALGVPEIERIVANFAPTSP